ncbi:alpha/beta-Hydrolases superfamily protein [Euphorbia peplus]|nr:alpha/beta-Hydrolases superfamily protein [Euphorbia peplus]
MAPARGCILVLDKLRRCVRTVIFMVAMVASLLVSSMPVLVAIGDVLLPFVLVSSFTCLTCTGFKEHLHKYAFKSSLTDIPLVSVIRSAIIICVYLMCDAPALSHGPYLGTVTLCSIISVLLLSVKACVFSVNSQIEAGASSSLSRQKLHLKKSWGMPVLFLSSVVFALGHTVVAYRTSCRARRKLMFHRVDAEAVLSCKNVFSGFQKVPRSPTPTAGRTPKSDSEMRRKPFGTAHDEGELPVRLLADIDSLFITCQGLTLHYKLCLPGSPRRSLSSATFLESPTCSSPRMTAGRTKLERQPFNVLLKAENSMHRSYSNQFHSSSLYAPLLEASPTSPVLSEEIPVLNLDDAVEENEMNKVNSGYLDLDTEEIGQTGIVLVHGFGGGVFSWRHVMGPLARQVGCRVAAFDRPGWGLTSRLRRKDWEDQELPNPYKLETQVDLLLAFCLEMGFSSVVLVGHDDGGLLALMAAQRLQTSIHSKVTIKALILLNVSLSREVVPAFARILLRTSLGKKHLVRPLLRTEIVQVVNRRAWYDSANLTAETLSLYKAPLYTEGWDEAIHEIGKLSCETILSQQISASLLKAVKDMPVLVVSGAEDALVPLKSSQAMASKLVNSRLVAISGCGHLPHEECPKALLAAMLPFLSRLLLRTDLENQ